MLRLLTVDDSEVGLVVATSLVSEVLSDVHVRINLLFQLLQHSTEVILPEFLIQDLDQLTQLHFSAVVPDPLPFLITVFLPDTERRGRASVNPCNLDQIRKLHYNVNRKCGLKSALPLDPTEHSLNIMTLILGHVFGFNTKMNSE